MKAGIVINVGDAAGAGRAGRDAPRTAGWDGVFTYDAIAIGGAEMYDPWALLGGDGAWRTQPGDAWAPSCSRPPGDDPGSWPARR